jgi:hypothetical protein
MVGGVKSSARSCSKSHRICQIRPSTKPTAIATEIVRTPKIASIGNRSRSDHHRQSRYWLLKNSHRLRRKGRRLTTPHRCFRRRNSRSMKLAVHKQELELEPELDDLSALCLPLVRFGLQSDE